MYRLLGEMQKRDLERPVTATENGRLDTEKAGRVPVGQGAEWEGLDEGGVEAGEGSCGREEGGKATAGSAGDGWGGNGIANNARAGKRLWGGGPLCEMPVAKLGGRGEQMGGGVLPSRGGVGGEGGQERDGGGVRRGTGLTPTPRTLAGAQAKAATDDALTANK